METDDQIPDLVPDNAAEEPTADEPAASTNNEEDEFVTVTSKRPHALTRKRKTAPGSSSRASLSAASFAVSSSTTEPSARANVTRVVPMRLVGASRPPSATSNKRQRTNTGASAGTVLSGSTTSQSLVAREVRRVQIPPNRFAPLKTFWPRILAPIVEHLRLQVCFVLPCNLPISIIEFLSQTYLCILLYTVFPLNIVANLRIRFRKIVGAREHASAHR